MAKTAAPRPVYRKEHRVVGILTAVCFLLLFLFRLIHKHFPFGIGEIPLSLLLETVVFLLPAFLFILFRGEGYRRTLRLHPPRGRDTPFLIAAFFALLSGCMLLSILCGGTESLGSSVSPFEETATGGVFSRIADVLVFALIPAAAEELLFRGIVTAEYERRGVIRAVVMSTLLFSLIHFDLRNLPVYLFSGFLFSLALFATDSLISVMLLHGLYNTVSLLGQRYWNALYRFTGNLSLFLFVVILVLLISLTVLARTGFTVYRLRDLNGIGSPRRNVPRRIQLYTLLDALSDPMILLTFAISIAGFIFL